MIRWLILTVSIVVGAAVLTVSGAWSGEIWCEKRTLTIAKLKQGYREVPTQMGMELSGNVVELLTSPDGKTWTLIATAPNGTSCVVAGGEHWQSVPKKPGEGT